MKKHNLPGRPFNLLSAEVIVLLFNLPSALFWWNSDVSPFSWVTWPIHDVKRTKYFISVFEAKIRYGKGRIRTLGGQNWPVWLSSITSQCLQSNSEEFCPGVSSLKGQTENEEAKNFGFVFVSRIGVMGLLLCGCHTSWCHSIFISRVLFLFVSQIDSETEGVWSWRVS